MDHFLPNGKPKSNVNTNGTTDWGLMQINQATFEQQWNWKSNLNQAVALLGQKQAQAQKYLNQHPQGVTPAMIENEMIQRYNGGRYYIWDSASAAWLPQPPNTYVASVRAIMNSRPW